MESQHYLFWAKSPAIEKTPGHFFSFENFKSPLYLSRPRWSSSSDSWTLQNAILEHNQKGYKQITAVHVSAKVARVFRRVGGEKFPCLPPAGVY